MRLIKKIITAADDKGDRLKLAREKVDFFFSWEKYGCVVVFGRKESLGGKSERECWS